MIVLTGPQDSHRGAARGGDLRRLPRRAGGDQGRPGLRSPTRSATRIDYWSGGGVLRWNQILRELVARYNLPPAPRPNGTYPAPDADNPFADPAVPVREPALRGARLQLRDAWRSSRR